MGWVAAVTSSVSSGAFTVMALLGLGHPVWDVVLSAIGIGPLVAGSLYAGRTEKRYRQELVGIAEERAAHQTELAESRVVQHKAQAKAEIAEARHRAIEMLCDVVYRFLKIDEVHGLRVTLLEVDNSSEVAVLRQVARCQPGGPCQLSESSMTIHQGVAGRCYRKIASAIVNVPPGEFIPSMLDLGFLHDEAKMLEARGSYLCCPVVNERKDVLGVLSLDALHPGAFDADKEAIAQQVTPLFVQWLTDPDREGL
ncbi:MAG: hypothetical protein JWM21_2667 [Acidobacteria bacterium]|nr:hypothetical protein [Acidobacteriota bacterium]